MGAGGRRRLGGQGAASGGSTSPRQGLPAVFISSSPISLHRIPVACRTPSGYLGSQASVHAADCRAQSSWRPSPVRSPFSDASRNRRSNTIRRAVSLTVSLEADIRRSQRHFHALRTALNWSVVCTGSSLICRPMRPRQQCPACMLQQSKATGLRWCYGVRRSRRWRAYLLQGSSH